MLSYLYYLDAYIYFYMPISDDFLCLIAYAIEEPLLFLINGPKILLMVVYLLAFTALQQEYSYHSPEHIFAHFCLIPALVPYVGFYWLLWHWLLYSGCYYVVLADYRLILTINKKFGALIASFYHGTRFFLLASRLELGDLVLSSHYGFRYSHWFIFWVVIVPRCLWCFLYCSMLEHFQRKDRAICCSGLVHLLIIGLLSINLSHFVWVHLYCYY